jgi:hypothetical protein
MTKKELPKGITQENIDEAIRKYGERKVKVFGLPLDDEGTNHLHVIIHEPDINTMGQYQQWSDKNWKKSNEILIRGCILGGKEICDEIIGSTELFLAAVDACAVMIPVRKAVQINL